MARVLGWCRSEQRAVSAVIKCSSVRSPTSSTTAQTTLKLSGLSQISSEPWQHSISRHVSDNCKIYVKTRQYLHKMMRCIIILAIVMSVDNVSGAPRARTYHTPWCAYLQGLTIPMSRSHTCIHGFIATQCGALCKKGPGIKKFQKVFQFLTKYFQQEKFAEVPET